MYFLLFQNSFAEVAKLFTEFFRDLDVVPTDIVAGLVLLRTHQKLRRKVIVSQVETQNRIDLVGTLLTLVLLGQYIYGFKQVSI